MIIPSLVKDFTGEFLLTSNTQSGFPEPPHHKDVRRQNVSWDTD